MQYIYEAIYNGKSVFNVKDNSDDLDELVAFFGIELPVDFAKFDCTFILHDIERRLRVFIEDISYEVGEADIHVGYAFTLFNMNNQDEDSG